MGGKGGKGKGKGKGSSGKGVKGSKGSKGAKGTPAKGKAAKKPSATKKSRGVGDGVPRRLKQHDDVSLTSGEMSDDNQMIEDDEDIDSDMAFGSSDEGLKKMFEDLEEKRATRSKGGKKKTPAPEEERIYASDESVDEGSDSSSEGDNDMINLSDLLDGKEAATKKSSYKPKVIETRKESEFESSSLRTVERPDLQDLIASLNVTEDRDAQSAKRLQKSLSKLSKSEDTSKLIQTPEEQYEKDTRERKLAAEGVEKELDQWNPTIRENRKREFSKYPLPEPNPIQKPNTSTAGITATPSTDMEKEIASMLTSAGLRSDEPEEEIKTSDFVKLQNDVFQLVDKDSDANTTVSRLKNVMSYEHEKKKRVKKIKSKIYRRMLRKEKEKSKDKKLELLALVDPEAALKKKKEEMMKLRAETRMNVRHKNKSQWMKNMKAMAKFDKGAQNALSADSRNRQQLLKKMDETVEDAQYNKGGSGSDDGYSSDSDGVETKEIDTLMSAGGKSDIFSKLRDEVNTDGPKKKGLFAMKFMQRSEQNDKADLLRQIDNLEDEVDNYHAGEKPDTGAEADAEEGEEVRVKKVKKVGRVRFSGQGDVVAPQRASGKKVRNAGAAAVTDDFVGEDISTKQAAGLDDDKPRSCLKRTRDTDSKAVHTAVAVADDEDVKELLRPKRRRIVKRVIKKKSKVQKDTEDADDAEEAAPVEAAAPAEVEEPKRKKGKKRKAKDTEIETSDGISMNQDYLVSRAFAADTLAAEFQKEKDAEVDKEVEAIDRNQALPGWGEWGGEDETLNQKSRERKAELEAERAAKVDVARQKRKDYKLKNVILNEEPTPDKYTLGKIPFPYRSPQQFEASMETPVGPDWNTESSTRRHTRPATKTEAGEIITPIEKDQGSRKAPKTKRRKTEKKPARKTA